jgi:hypothetical protein
MQAMDVIDYGSPPRRFRQAAVWLAIGLLAAGGVFLWNRASSQDPAERIDASATTRVIPTTHVTPPIRPTANIPLSLREAALNSLPRTQLRGDMEAVGNDFADGYWGAGLTFTPTQGPGRYAVTIVCLGRGGLRVWVGDAYNRGFGAGIRVHCTGKPADQLTAEVVITGATLDVYVRPDADTAGGFAIAAYPIRPTA